MRQDTENGTLVPVTSAPFHAILGFPTRRFVPVLLCAAALAAANEEHAGATPEHAPAVAPPTEGAHPASGHEENAPSATDHAPPGDAAREAHGEHPSPQAPAKAHERVSGEHGAPKLDSGVLAGQLPRREIAWKAKAGPLLLASDVVVGPGRTLEIGPGVEIRVAARDAAPMGAGDWADSQFVSLIVAGGTLRILGTPERPVRFVPLRKGAPPLWGGIRIVDIPARSQAEIAWADIPRAHVGIDLDRGSAVVRHVVVREATIAIQATGGAAPKVSHSILFGSRIAGLRSALSGPVVRNSIFVDNAGAGARFEGVGLARLETNAFWNNAGGDLVRGPAGAGGWTGDSIVRPDAYGNVRANPVFRGSVLHARLLAIRTDSLRTAPLWKRRLPLDPWGGGPWALSPFSPLVDRGGLSPLCRDRDGSRCDIGLWGGKD